MANQQHVVDVSTGETSQEDWSAPASPPPAVEAYQAAIQTMVDDTARSKLYNDGVTMASYVASTVQPWASQAQAFVAWRDAVWQYAYAELDKVMTGQRTQPTVEEFLAEIDPIIWPTV